MDVTFTEEQQAFVDELVGKARVKAREKAEAEFTAQANTSAAEAEEARLKAEKQWETLAANAQAKVKELEPYQAEAVAYRELISGMLKDKVKALGDDAKKAVAGLNMSDLDKLNWLNANENIFRPVGDGVGTPHRTKRQAMPAKAANKANGYRPITI